MAEQSLSLGASTDTFLGFDYGIRKIGVAVGQLETGTASPLETVRAVRQKTNWAVISRLIETWRPGGLVVGVSYQTDGSENPVTPHILRFCRQLEGRYGLPVYQVDERLSTYESKQLLFDELNVSAGKLWAVQDQLAAQLILQSWLNQKNASVKIDE
jgi:putative pre-16S rRNA nuclease